MNWGLLLWGKWENVSISHSFSLKILKDLLEIPRKDDVEKNAIKAIFKDREPWTALVQGFVKSQT